MLSWLASIGDAIGVMMQLIVSLFNGLIQLFTLVPKAITFTLAAFAYIPPPLVVFATAASNTPITKFLPFAFSISYFLLILCIS